jgi:hypothetical protein
MTRLSCLIPYEMGVGRCFQHVLGSPEGPLNLRLARLRRSITIAVPYAVAALIGFWLAVGHS